MSVHTIDPATGEPIATHDETTAAELEALLDRARERATARAAVPALDERRWCQSEGRIDPHGHSTPERAAAAAAGAASITSSRYTHALPGDLERAREQLDSYIAKALQEARETGS